MKIPITKSIFDEADKQAIIKPLDTGWVVQGPHVAAFEKLFSEFTGAQFAHASSNCTTALHLGLEAFGIGQGDKVVVPAFTYVASANAVEYTGASVVFCDIELETFNIDIKKLEQILQQDPAIKAIMPVHLFGLCAEMPAIMKLAEQYQLRIIEDAACAFDSWIGDKHAGTFGDCGCFSFHPRKAITTGEGGMLITDSEQIAKQVAQLRDHGASKSDLQRHKDKGAAMLPDFTMRGYNYRMTDIQGALGVSQLQKAQYIMQGRRRIAQRYNEALKQFPMLRTPSVIEGYTHGYQSYVCLFLGNEKAVPLDKNKIDDLNQQRNDLMSQLEERGIATRQGTHAVHALSYYKNRYALDLWDYPMAYAADRLSITFPVYADMTDVEFDYVIDHLRAVCSQSKARVALYAS